MSEMNTLYLKRRGPTDVISFPAAEIPTEELRKKHLGDLIICPGKIRQQAKKAGRTYEKELSHIFIHGVLHLLGFDHDIASRKRVMRSEEKRILNILFPRTVTIKETSRTRKDKA